ncbi:hypothetical protein DIPPA_34071 [Diplonema papillatum]|nr:hypothetical protein DIPPA_34071 [Diplonema papillatum]
MRRRLQRVALLGPTTAPKTGRRFPMTPPPGRLSRKSDGCFDDASAAGPAAVHI